MTSDWTVLEFKDSSKDKIGNTVEIDPSNWITEEGFCKFLAGKENISKLICNKVNPSEDWELHSISQVIKESITDLARQKKFLMMFVIKGATILQLLMPKIKRQLMNIQLAGQEDPNKNSST